MYNNVYLQTFNCINYFIMQFKHAICINTILKIRYFYGLNSMIRKRKNYVIANFHNSFFYAIGNMDI